MSQFLNRTSSRAPAPDFLIVSQWPFRKDCQV